MTTVFYTSTLFACMTLAAAIDEGRFGPHDERRLLLVSNNTATPEAHPSVVDQPGFAAIRDRFDDIVSWNEVIAPLHPSDWMPRQVEVPMLQRLMRQRLDLQQDPTELVLESLAVSPARSIATLIRDCPISVISDGLMSYGPTRNSLPEEMSGRVRRLVHLDLAPGIAPLLLSEYGVPAEAISTAAFRDVVATVPAAESVPARGRRALILGQYLSALDLLSVEEEAALHTGMLDAVVAGGYDDVVFKPHPAAGRAHARELTAAAAARGVRLSIAADSEPAEVCFGSMRPDLVVGCFSTALTTASLMYGIPVACMGAELMLERLTPYENSNRIPTTIVDATVPRLQPDGSVVAPPAIDLHHLVRAVGYCMQASAYPHLRATAAEYIARHGRARYFKKLRLEAIGLIPRSRTNAARRRAAEMRAEATRRVQQARTRARA